MAKRVQLRRGTTAQTNAFTGAVGEVTVDTSKNTLVVHNGVTAGGTPLLTENRLVDGSETVKGIVELATQAEVNTGTDTTRVVTPATLSGTFLQKTKNALSATGDAPISACRAKLVMNGVGGAEILSSMNILSVTRVSTARYEVVFINPMSDSNYAIAGCSQNKSTSGTAILGVSLPAVDPTVNGFTFTTGYGSSLSESSLVSVLVY